MHLNFKRLCLSLLLLGFAPGCSCGDEVNPTGAGAAAGQGGDGGQGAEGGQGGEPPGAPPASPKALVKLKTGDRYRTDVGLALELDPAAVCNELGAFDCSFIHQVVMGRSDPYLSALYEPLEATSATSPLAYERVAVSGCVQRADADLTGPTQVVFVDLPIADGAFTDASSPALAESVRTLYRRGLSREATDSEIAAALAIYPSIEAADAETPARSWAIATCVAVLTSVENVFF